MKCFNIIFTLLFSFQISYGQTTWASKIPHETTDALNVVKDMIMTDEGEFIILMVKYVQEDFFKRKHYMVKYNAIGELVWEKEYDFGVQNLYNPIAIYPGGPEPNKLSKVNDSFYGRGLYYESDTIFCYVFEFNTMGDSLSFTKEIEDEERCLFPQFYIDSKIYDINADPITEEYSLIELDDDLQVLNEVVLGDYGISKPLLGAELNPYLIRHSVQGVFRKFSPSGDLLYEEEYENEYLGEFNVFSKDGYLTSYREGLIQLNEDLSVRWYRTPEDLLIAPNAPQLKQNAQFITATSDGGFVMGGNYGPGGPISLVYLIKVDEIGEWEWGYSYGPDYIGLNYLFKLIEVDDGYVFVGTSEVTNSIWITKLNKDGLFTTSLEDGSLLTNPSISIFPNPTSDILNISFTKPFMGTLKLLNSNGVEIYSNHLEKKINHDFDLSHFLNGIYFVVLVNEELGQVYSEKVIKMSRR